MNSNKTKIKITSGQKIIGNTIFSSLSELSLLFTSVFYILVARYLGKAEFGKFGAARGFVGLFTILIIFGFSYSITKVIVKERDKAGVFVGNAFYIQWLFSVFSFAACIFTAYVLKSKYPLEVRYLIAIIFVAESLRCFNLTLREASKALGGFHYDTIAMNAERIFLVTVGVFVLIAGFGLFMVALVLAVSRLISFILLVLFMRKMHHPIVFKPNFKIAKMLIHESWIYLIQAAFLKLYDYIDVVMISLMRSFSEVGWYSAGRQILEGLWFIPNIVTEAIYPELNARNWVSKQLVIKLFDRSFKYMLSLSVIVSMGTIIIARPLIFLFYGHDFNGAVIVLILLGAAVVPSYLRFMFGNTLIAINLQKKVIPVLMARSFFNILLNLILIPFFGYVGATVATVTVEYFSLSVYIVLLKKEGLINASQLKFIYKPFVAVILLIPIYLIAHSLNEFLKFLLVILIYVVILYVLKIFNEEEITAFKEYVSTKWKRLKN